MIYSVIKTIQNDVNNDDFICMCKKSYRKTCLVCLIIIAAIILFGLAAYLFHDYNKAFDFFIWLVFVRCRDASHLCFFWGMLMVVEL